MSIPPIEVFDTKQFGHSQTGAVYALGASGSALVESGTATSVDRLLSQLGDRHPKLVFLTHIHLDHAGGAGQLANLSPDVRIVLHSKGLSHMTDPSRLIEGVRSASPKLFPLYGEPRPIPRQQLVAVRGGETFLVEPNLEIEVIAAPGHAPHHVCYFERTTRTLFTGDAAGNHNTRVDVPLTVPPRFDLAEAIATLHRLKTLEPRQLAFTHYGIAQDAMGHLDRYERALTAWFALLRQLRRSHTDDDVVKAIMEQDRFSHLDVVERDMAIMCIRGALLSFAAGAG